VVTLGLSLLAYRYLHSPLAGYVGPPRSVLYNLLVIQSWFFNDGSIRQAWNGVTWSLSCEMFFYACSPLLLVRIRALSVKTCTWLMIGIFGLYCVAQLASDPTVGSTAQNFFYYFPLARLPEFVIGALACQMLIKGYRLPFRRVWLVFAIAVIGPLAIYSQLGARWQVEYTIASLVVLPGFVLTILAAAGRDMDRRKARKPVLLATNRMVWLGNVSYSYYMVHALVLGAVGLALTHLVGTTTSIWEGSAWMVIFLLLSLLAAWIAWRLVERPGQKSLLHLLRRRSPRGQAEAAA
jgi:peptidoglycan/LPS O-acetylase OafA/YrhL